MPDDVSALQLLLAGDPTLLAIVRLSLIVSLSAVVFGALIGVPFGAAVALRAIRSLLTSARARATLISHSASPTPKPTLMEHAMGNVPFRPVAIGSTTHEAPPRGNPTLPRLYSPLVCRVTHRKCVLGPFVAGLSDWSFPHEPPDCLPHCRVWSPEPTISFCAGGESYCFRRCVDERCA